VSHWHGVPSCGSWFWFVPWLTFTSIVWVMMGSDEALQCEVIISPLSHISFGKVLWNHANIPFQLIRVLIYISMDLWFPSSCNELLLQEGSDRDWEATKLLGSKFIKQDGSDSADSCPKAEHQEERVTEIRGWGGGTACPIHNHMLFHWLF
jgi:hypothetical protein